MTASESRRLELAENVCRELTASQEQIDTRGLTCSPNVMLPLKAWQQEVEDVPRP